QHPRRNASIRSLFARMTASGPARSEEHTSELQSLAYLVCRLLLEKKTKITDGLERTPPRGVDGAIVISVAVSGAVLLYLVHLTTVSPRQHAVCALFFFNDTATTEIYTLSLHDALPI